MTDSGGYQVFSLAKRRSISEEGVKFNSPLNGDSVFLSPESCMQLQADFGVDIAMVLDECSPFPIKKEEAKESMLLSMRWAQRCRDNFSSEKSGLFGIVQGGMFKDLREESLEKLIKENKGSLVNTKLLGKRQLAYPINNMNYANYVHLDVELNTDTLQLLEEKFKFDQNVFRHLTVKVEQ